MPRFRLRTAFLAVAFVSLVCGFMYFIAHIDDPYATIIASKDNTIALTEQASIDLTESALRLAGLKPVRPWAAYGSEGDSERFINRNLHRPNDRVSVIWDVSDSSSFGVSLDRETNGIKATIRRAK